MIVGVTGNARAGKDTLAAHLIKHYGFERIGMADPMKRFCQEVFGFSDEQLYGEERDAPDKRYRRIARTIVEHEDARFLAEIDSMIRKLPPPAEPYTVYLTPRFALQTLGTEWGRLCYPDIWIEYAVRTALVLLRGDHLYDVKRGLRHVEGMKPPRGVVFSDLRFKNEFDVIKKSGGLMVRIYREGQEGNVGIAGHASEEEQKTMPDQDFDVVIHNPPGLENYYRVIDQTLGPKLDARRHDRLGAQ